MFNMDALTVYEGVGISKERANEIRSKYESWISQSKVSDGFNILIVMELIFNSDLLDNEKMFLYFQCGLYMDN